MPPGKRDEVGLESQLERLENRLNRIEELLISQQSEMDEVRSLFGFFRGSLRFYDEVSHLLSYVSSFKSASRHSWILKDELAKDIVLDLARKGPRNISQLARDIREERGTSSRRIIAQRVERLIECGIVTEVRTGGSRKLRLGSDGMDSPAKNVAGKIPRNETSMADRPTSGGGAP